LYGNVDFNNKSILITGGAGFIGSNIAFYLQKNYPNANIVIFDNFSSGHFKNLIGFNGEIVTGDIINQNEVDRLNDFKFDYIMHQAAITDTTVMGQNEMMEANVNGFKRILELAIKNSASLVYASSAGVYGNSVSPNSIGKGEIPENIYGFSKLMMDKLSYSYMKKVDISIVGLRYFNVYGPREVYKGKTASMILQLGLQLLNGQKPKLFKWGEQKRDFVFIEDIIQANIKGLQAKNSGVYNVGSGEARSFNEIYGILTHELDIYTEIEYMDNPYKFYQNHTEADIKNTKSDLNYNPNYRLESGINSYVSEIKRIFKTEFAK
jgi:ADP-L-glycero-D-manno-heptose 6-epimerase